MKLIPVIDWALVSRATERLDPRLLPLLDAIAASRSLAAAIGRCGISYRAGWGLLRDYEQKLGAPLALLERGRGASLTALGQQLVQAERTAGKRLETVLPTLAVELSTEAAKPKQTPAKTLRVAASHDLVLASLAASMPQFAPGLELTMAFMGSLRALQEFSSGNADLAGFHVPHAHDIQWEPREFRRWLSPKADRLIRFIDRDQGLILPKGNPASVRNFRDIAKSSLRFVNRQRGSGTRLVIDQLLADAGIAPSAISGYANEEFTHAAVAATVASGGADAGFGLRAAAAEYGLGFIALLREHYYLAARARDTTRAPLAQLLEVLRSAQFAQHVRRFPGCSAAGSGTIEPLSVLDRD